MPVISLRIPSGLRHASPQIMREVNMKLNKTVQIIRAETLAWVSRTPSPHPDSVNGERVPVYAEVEVTAFRDSNYGADADGRRGIEAWFIEDMRIISSDIDDLPEHNRAKAEEELLEKAEELWCATDPYDNGRGHDGGWE